MPQIENMSRCEITEELRSHVHDEVYFNWMPFQTTQILAALLHIHRSGYGPNPLTILTEAVKLPVVAA